VTTAQATPRCKLYSGARLHDPDRDRALADLGLTPDTGT